MIEIVLVNDYNPDTVTEVLCNSFEVNIYKETEGLKTMHMDHIQTTGQKYGFNQLKEGQRD